MFLKLSTVVLGEPKGVRRNRKNSEEGERFVGTTICASIETHNKILVESKKRLSVKQKV